VHPKASVLGFPPFAKFPAVLALKIHLKGETALFYFVFVILAFGLVG
jgi:hypothetical protein